MTRGPVWLAGLLLLAPLCLLAALLAGTVETGPADLLAALRGDNSTTALVIRELRLPRALTAFAVGGLLALAGSLLQVLLRNPLADPYILGVSGGASVSALTAMLLGLGTALIMVSAFGGALITIVLVFVLARMRAPAGSERLLLTGVILASGFGAVVSLLLTLAPASALPGMIFWLLGDLAYARQPLAGLIVLALGLIVAMSDARSLNVLARGERVAATLGENPDRLRWKIYLLTALLTAVAVTLAGAVGFVGLLVPHLLRLLGFTDHRLLLPAAVLLGGSLLTLADTLARWILSPMSLPVGVVTALIGVPVFLFLLSRGDRS
ncbi:MAG: iron ABC transporter permease [Pseudomonadota bacterium]